MAPRGGRQTSYGFPLYGASWIPLAHILHPADDADVPPPRPMVVLGGGGGEGNNRVPNALVVAALDPAAAAPALSPDPVRDRSLPPQLALLGKVYVLMI